MRTRLSVQAWTSGVSTGPGVTGALTRDLSGGQFAKSHDLDPAVMTPALLDRSIR